MSDTVTIADRGRRAELAWNEFVAPEFDHLRKAYADRMIEVAVAELDPKRRADKITSLSTAIRIMDEIEKGVFHIVRDGQVADREMLRVEKVERMSPARRKILGI